jgi:putative sigma-54 modulation protein
VRDVAPKEIAVELRVTGRHLQITDSMKRYAEDKAGKLTHYYDRIETADLILDHASQTFKVEIVARADHKHVFVAHADGVDFHAAFDVALEKIERQLTRHKERYRNRKHASAPEQAQLPEAGL